MLNEVQKEANLRKLVQPDFLVLQISGMTYSIHFYLQTSTETKTIRADL